eukprot:gnl/Carplike_NY0171/1405_a1912_681.p1 GENE.gnl/Carplike_NY0171/1405_a1912_681~~gnl/Carplike_NY0171/1405_a1912_681.p1  ORF type:complete len:549 (-),score=231.97 gnl/Carplike_NY0171/1405_a1912_681:135-1745(-)
MLAEHTQARTSSKKMVTERKKALRELQVKLNTQLKQAEQKKEQEEEKLEEVQVELTELGEFINYAKSGKWDEDWQEKVKAREEISERLSKELEEISQLNEERKQKSELLVSMAKEALEAEDKKKKEEEEKKKKEEEERKKKEEEQAEEEEEEHNGENQEGEEEGKEETIGGKEEEEEEEGELLTRTSEERVRKEREIQSDVISREEEEKKESSSSVSIIGNGKKEGSKVESIGSFNWEKVSEMLDSPIFEPSFDHKAAISAIAEARIPSYLAQLGISSTYSVSKDEEEEEDGDTFSKVIGKIKAKGHVHLGEGSESEATSVVESAEVVESMHKQQDKNVLSSLLGLMGKMVHSLHISECILWVRRLSVVYINELSCSNGVMEVFKGQYDVEKMRTSLRCLSLTGCVVLCARFVDELLAVSKRYIQKKIKMDSKISVLQEKVLELQQIVKRERIEREEREMKEEHGKKSRKSKKPRKTKNENFLAKAMAELESLALSDEEIERLTDVAEILSIIGYEEHAHDMKCCFNFKKQASLFF